MIWYTKFHLRHDSLMWKWLWWKTKVIFKSRKCFSNKLLEDVVHMRLVNFILLHYVLMRDKKTRKLSRDFKIFHHNVMNLIQLIARTQTEVKEDENIVDSFLNIDDNNTFSNGNNLSPKLSSWSDKKNKKIAIDECWSSTWMNSLVIVTLWNSHL